MTSDPRPSAPDLIAQLAAAERARLAQLAASPLIEISGVVDPVGPGGGKSRGDELWTLRFTLQPWRLAGTLHPEPLHVCRQVTDQALADFQQRITPYAVVRLRARVAHDQTLSRADALLEELLGPDPHDAELHAHAQQLQRPVTHHDPTFGPLTLDRRIHHFTAKITWNGTPATLSLPSQSPNDLAASLRTAHALWHDRATWDQRIRACALHHLLPLKNDNWRDTDEPEVTPEAFLQAMTLTDITADPDGSFEFWHDDGDLFWGHSICVRGSLTDGPIDAEIAG